MSTAPFPGEAVRLARALVINHGQLAAAISTTRADIERLEGVECPHCRNRAATLAQRREELAALVAQADALAAHRARAARLFEEAPPPMDKPASYPVNTLAEMARIPEEALPRFMAELPEMLAVVRVHAAMNAEARALLGHDLVTLKDLTWTDDGKRGGSVTVRVPSDG